MSLHCFAVRRRFWPRALPCSRCSTIRLLALLAFAATLAGAFPGAVAAEPTPPPASIPAGAPIGVNGTAGTFRLRLPLIQTASGSSITGAAYTTIPVPPPPTDRPASAHADLNLALRGYTKTSATLGLVAYGGDTDPGAPQMPGIFSDHRTPQFTSAYQVYEWNWGCGVNGCRASAISSPSVTLLGMRTSSGERLHAPARFAEIYDGGFVAVVLYADEQRITLKYTRDDNVVSGYTVHLEKMNVDGNLLALYRRADAAGRGQLPGITNGQPLGLASGSEVLVAIRDCGAFLDPRSRKDWWQGR